ncbi:HLA class II histocompatibility antigen, DR beta 4 chain [Stylosanthes scabra]|uniref:HLA class II histocompatibility antigen, DR beta 4 chain n=1 Tax=Stylosanthes scabra TaxID=79078 RepID=A0ABU6TAG9_9FABA|nr:HLA class II histocompatibility antigen, DR beta 4 chain [Stylosanthes scabra]
MVENHVDDMLDFEDYRTDARSMAGLRKIPEASAKASDVGNRTIQEYQMYKTKVQELCQKRSWSLPEYETTRGGPDHNPGFTAAVTVTGIRFEIQSSCRSSKEAQNNAAMLAFQHLSSSSQPPPSFITSGRIFCLSHDDLAFLCRNQTYCLCFGDCCC